MTRTTRLLILSAVVAIVPVTAARAQFVGVGVARPGGIYGTYWPGAYGVFSGGYQGFYSNGFSMYGPPVPTYGSVPGMFGGADQRLSNFPNIYIQNGADFGLGGSGAGGAGPRRRFYAGADSVGQQMPTMGQAIIDVRLPTPDAEVYFEGNNTKQTGVRRTFQSPVVQVGTTYYYKIRARWKQPDGTVADEERTIGLRANATTTVEFDPKKHVEEKPLIAAN
jgi:uncharacterized protein (TIGR03000 family)